MSVRFPSVALHVVSDAQAPEPPYPGDILARGWRFDLEPERIRQSDTWALAGSEWRPWLLMLWLTAWEQRPVGSLPNNHEVTAALIGMDRRIFAAHADILLRGWRLHADSRLYHPVITEHVLRMVEKRVKDRERVSRWRACNALPTRDQRVSTTPTPTPTPKEDTHPADESAKTLRVSTRPACPYAEILDLWRELMPELPRPHGVEHWTAARKAQIRARWNDQLPDLDAWRECFGLIRRSPFLMGHSAPTPGRRQFQCDLFWITKPENLLKLYEGKYDG